MWGPLFRQVLMAAPKVLALVLILPVTVKSEEKSAKDNPKEGTDDK